MKQLLVLRHAKSSWDNPSLDDHERPLAPRGKRDARRMGQWIQQEGMMPSLTVCSTATRARATFKRVFRENGFSGEVRFVPGLYPGELETVLACLREIPERFDSVLLIGHNPGLEELITRLTGRDEALPTAALAFIALDVAHWSDVGSRTPSAELRLLQRPRELSTGRDGGR